MGEPASKDDPLLDDGVVPYALSDPANPGNAAIVELRSSPLHARTGLTRVLEQP